MISVTIDKELEPEWSQKQYDGSLVHINDDDYMVADVEKLDNGDYKAELIEVYNSRIKKEDQVIAGLDRSFLNRHGKRMQDEVAARLRNAERNEKILEIIRLQCARKYQLQKGLIKGIWR